MREVTEKFNVFTFKTASKELKQKIIENFDSDGFLYEHCMEERIETLKEFTKYIGGTLDYSISLVPDRGEFITIKGYVNDLVEQSLSLKNCPFTGVCYDDDLIDFIKNNIDGEMSLDGAFNDYLKSIHDEYQSMLEEDYISDLCEANDYEFTEDGKIY